MPPVLSRCSNFKRHRETIAASPSEGKPRTYSAYSKGVSTGWEPRKEPKQSLMQDCSRATTPDLFGLHPNNDLMPSKTEPYRFSFHYQ